jgi:type II secretory pathway pseudopilin PulG
LIETLAVIAIVTVLAALSYPVYTRAVLKSREATAGQNLHQIGLATALYRADAGGEGIYGPMYAMGLPLILDQLKPYGFTDAQIIWIPEERLSWRRAIYRRYATPEEEAGQSYKWSQYAQKNGDGVITNACMAFTQPGVEMFSPFDTYKGIGVRLDTSILTRVRGGNWSDYDWWE